jgi:ribosome-binding protein aMBF1 (putative translation factor)
MESNRQRWGQKGGRYTAAQSSKKAAALVALFARRRGQHVNDPGVSPDQLAHIMQAVHDLTRAQFQRERVSQRALAQHLGVSDRTVRRWISGHQWPDKKHVRKMRRWLQHIGGI